MKKKKDYRAKSGYVKTGDVRILLVDITKIKFAMCVLPRTNHLLVMNY